MKAIETRYKGCRFRSRLEARWAVLMDALGCEWAYEPQGFNLAGSLYLPDFWVRFKDQSTPYPRGIPPECGFYIEIKPTDLTTLEKELCRLLCEHTGHCVYAAGGNIGHLQYDAYKWHPSGNIIVNKRGEGECYEHYSILDFYLVWSTWSEEYCPSPADMDRAFAAARSARFEHGETP